jgi:hypothetical protein
MLPLQSQPPNRHDRRAARTRAKQAHDAAKQAVLYIPRGADRIAIAHGSQVCERSVVRAYQGKVKSTYTWRRIADTATALGFPPPPAPAAEKGRAA